MNSILLDVITTVKSLKRITPEDHKHVYGDVRISNESGNLKKKPNIPNFWTYIWTRPLYCTGEYFIHSSLSFIYHSKERCCYFQTLDCNLRNMIYSLICYLSVSSGVIKLSLILPSVKERSGAEKLGLWKMPHRREALLQIKAHLCLNSNFYVSWTMESYKAPTSCFKPPSVPQVI